MKKILLTSVAALILQGAVTANAAFDNGDLKGTYGYSLQGQSGNLFYSPITDILHVVLAAVNSSFPNFVTEVGVIKADGKDDILITGRTAVRVNHVFNTNNTPLSGAQVLNFDTTYDCNPYTVNYKGQGTVQCTRTDSNPAIPGVGHTRTVLIEFVIDDHDNKEIRFFEKELPFLQPNFCFEEAEDAELLDLEGNPILDPASGEPLSIQVPLNRDPLCRLLLEGSATKQFRKTFPHKP